MDLLFRQYASPFLLLDAVISSGRFDEWIDQFLKSHKEKIQWECWLHKVFDKSWKEYVDATDITPTPRMTASDVEATINNSHDIISGFVPEK